MHWLHPILSEVKKKIASVSHSAWLCDPMDCCLPGSPIHWILQARITGVGSYSLLQRIFLTQGLNLGLLHCRQILYGLSHQGSPEATVEAGISHTIPQVPGHPIGRECSESPQQSWPVSSAPCWYCMSRGTPLGGPSATLSGIPGPSFSVCRRLLHNNKEFPHTRRVSENSVQSWHHLPGDGIGFHRLKVHFIQTALHCGYQAQTRLLPVFLTDCKSTFPPWVQ